MGRRQVTELTHASFFSGIGAFDLGFEKAGFRSVSYAEVKPYSCAVHETHWPDVPNLGDINAICPDGVGPLHECAIPKGATVWTGGFPCSDLSVMGQRKGLHGGERSSLALVFLDLVDRHRPDFVVLENVPGLLSSNEGRDLATLLDLLVELGYGWAYRVLDARNFGLPQSRRRVFVVAGPSANAAGAVLDEATPRSVALEPLGGARGTAVAGSARGADPDRDEVHTYVVGPTYSRGGDSRSISRKDDTFPLTPSNEQYVLEPTVIVAGFPKRAEQHLPSRDDGTSYALTPGIIPYVIQPDGEPPVITAAGGEHGKIGQARGSAFTVRPPSPVTSDWSGPQYVVEPDPTVAVYVSKYGPAARNDGASYLVKPHAWSTEGQYVLEHDGDDVLGGRGGSGGDGGEGALGAGLLDQAGAGRGPEPVPADADQEADADRVREAAGVSGRLDDREPGDDSEVWPVDLDNARWHVLGRTLPVPIAAWIGAGLATVIANLEADPHAYDDPEV